VARVKTKAPIARVFILAGGLGTRLRSVVSDRAKSAAMVAGRPFLHHVLQQIATANITRDVTLCVGHLAQTVEDEFGYSFESLRLSYSQEPQPLGTGGALRHALKKQKSDHSVIAMNGDTYVALNWEKLIDHHRLANADLTMALTYARDSRRFGTVKLDRDTPVGFLEKGASRSGWINAGVYVLGPAAQQAILKLPEKSSLEQDFFAPAFTQLQCSAYRSRARFIDIGVPEDFARAQKLLA
jgi:D-glycero-alpha-D-manno-heptose 1-phosphate guanylyltransferase